MENIRRSSRNLVFTGFGLVIASLIWQFLFGSSWSEKKAEQYTQSAAKFHRMLEEKGRERNAAAEAAAKKDAEARKKGKVKPGDPPPPLPPIDEQTIAQLSAQRDQMQKDFQAQRAELESSRAGGSTIAWFLKWIGVLLVIGGCVDYARGLMHSDGN